ncbi:MAG: protoglobin domain-containing protein [Anaerolineales bacterium]|nr:protoglobin domain-containing protein [Anaerolineales bacterium]
MNADLELYDLQPEPSEEWERMLRFVGWDEAARQAAAATVDVLFPRGHELVVATYEYLRTVPETAAVLGWEHGVDEAHLAERRRFFTLWLARTLGLDTSAEFADYLFRAGQYHAGHGPRRIHTPPQYVTGSIGLVQAAFARYLAEAGVPAPTLAAGLAAWSKYLSVQLNQMLLGYRAAQEAEQGAVRVPVEVFGRLRPLVGRAKVNLHVDEGQTVRQLLNKFFNYYPQTRVEALDRRWQAEEKRDSLWLEPKPVYTPRYGWRVLRNGRDVEYEGGFSAPLHPGDTVAIFPPGR